ncbi:hypothetical protein [Cochlodiniinecator piscidefendens]|uniref:hypothetical protein n=1 Tax=Cochlodiniinecator piscidefendens TaxID=2715756 RepID=UPI0014099570|nr:hypothetical protein [Cochlodiniinecator piscidefendens]
MNQLLVLSNTFETYSLHHKDHKSWLEFGEHVETTLEHWYGRAVDIEALHEIAITVAKNYHDQSINYDTADRIMNCLWPIFLAKTTDLPPPFWDIFQAFDAGEFHRNADKSDDPVKEYTDPMITQIIARMPE